MNSKNVLLAIAAVLLAVVIGGEVCVYFGYDLYHSDNGVFVRHKAYIATYENMSESELRQKAEAGDADAMAMLGGKLWFANRDSVSNEVLVLVQKSADENCARGKNMLGFLYAAGYCVPQDANKAFGFFKEAADNKEPNALYNIGLDYLNGAVVPKDTLEGLRCIEMSALQGYPFAQYKLGELYFIGGDAIKKDIHRGIEWLTLASDQGKPTAQYALSMIYYKGEDGYIAPDYNKAKELCRKAAEQGFPEAKWALENKFNSKND